VREPDLIKTNVPGLLKDKNTSMVINSNEGDFARIKASRIKGKQLLELRNELNQAKKDIQRIFEILGTK
jgi:hypothetical protein